MSLKRAIIGAMGRDDLKAVCDDLEIDGVDRRSRDEMATVISRSRRATAESLLEHLRETQVKEVCDVVGVSSRGRRRELIGRLLGGDEQSAGAGVSRNKAHRDRSHERDGGSEDRVEEDVTWTPAENAVTPRAGVQGETRPVFQPSPSGSPSLQFAATELVWPRKYDEEARATEPPRISLPFQVIEVIDVVKHALLTPRNPARSMDYRADRRRIRAPINSAGARFWLRISLGGRSGAGTRGTLTRSPVSGSRGRGGLRAILCC